MILYFKNLPVHFFKKCKTTDYRHAIHSQTQEVTAD